MVGMAGLEPTSISPKINPSSGEKAEVSLHRLGIGLQSRLNLHPPRMPGSCSGGRQVYPEVYPFA